MFRNLDPLPWYVATVTLKLFLNARDVHYVFCLLTIEAEQS
jgi:hypothetical protein